MAAQASRAAAARRSSHASFADLVVAAGFSVAVILDAGPRLPLGLDLYRPVPEANPLTPEKIALGRRLYHDRRLSRDGSLACSSCHDSRRAFADNRSVAVGVGGARGCRSVPSIINRAWGRSFFWDGRAATLEQQALLPILNGADPVLDDVARALATYVRTIVAGDSPYDRFAAGNGSALSESARRGLTLVAGRAGCTACQQTDVHRRAVSQHRRGLATWHAE